MQRDMFQESNLRLRHRELVPLVGLMILLSASGSVAAGKGAQRLKSLRVDAVTNVQSVDLTLQGAPATTPSYDWIVTDPAGTKANTKPGTPTSTLAPALNGLFFSTPGSYNAQVLFTAPGERVVGAATSVVVGPPSGKTPPTARLSASFILPEVGDEVFFDVRQSTAGKSPTGTIDFGDGTTATMPRGTAKHIYTKAGWYRATALIVDSSGANAKVFLDLVVSESIATVSDAAAKFAQCMVDLRASSVEHTCQDPANPLNNAHFLTPGDSPNMNGCVPAPTLADPDGWRCLTQQSLKRCRRYANGHRHLASYPVRHCQPEEQPFKLSFPEHGEVLATVNPAAYLGLETSTIHEAWAQVVFNNFGPPTVPGTCDPVIAADHDRTCDVVCLEAYFTLSDAPGGPDIPVIEGLPCDTTFSVNLDPVAATGGDSHEQMAANCTVLVPNAGDPPVQYETAMWGNVTGHFLWEVPRTEVFPGGSSWEIHPYNVAEKTIAVSAPVTVYCEH